MKRSCQRPRAPAAAPAAAALLLTLLAASAPPPAAASVLGGVTLSNFQGEYACDNSTFLIVRPRTVADVQAAVVAHATVKAAGAGHSWSGVFTCPASPKASLRRRGTSAAVALTTMRPLSIAVNVTDESVWVDAAVITNDLLRYLSDYTSPDAPAGWTLTIGGAVSTGSHGSSLTAASLSSSRQLLALELVAADGTLRRFTPQNSPFLFKALRVSVGRLGIITRVQLRIVREQPVRRGLQVLGPQNFLEHMRALQEGARAAEAAAAASAGGGSPYLGGAIPPQLPAWANETEFFWIPQTHEFLMVTYRRADSANATAAAEALRGFVPDATTVFESRGEVLRLGELSFLADAALNLSSAQLRGAQQPLAKAAAPDAAARLFAGAARAVAQVKAEVNAPLEGLAAAGGADPAMGSAWQQPAPQSPSAFYAAENMAEGTNAITRIGVLAVAGNASLESSAAYIKQPNTTLAQLRRVLYDQYEVSFPLSVAYDCFEAILEAAYGDDLAGADPAKRATDKGFRTAPLIRLVGQEDEALLSQTFDGPRVFVNLEDYIFLNTRGRPNTRFRAVIAAATADPRCTSRGPVRLHWGKAGWPDPGCWRGDEVYGANFCSFGCAVRALDPAAKFSDGAADRWTWAGVDLGRCCGDDGFDATRPGCTCSVRHARPREDCPPAPFYTTR